MSKGNNAQPAHPCELVNESLVLAHGLRPNHTSCVIAASESDKNQNDMSKLITNHYIIKWNTGIPN